jgi:4-hydroxy-4-methyl-2-oxoglutarate aldolase
MSLGNAELHDRFSTLTTPLVADACVRVGCAIRCAPPEMLPLISGKPIAGRALPVRHLGSVDAFLSTLDGATTGDVLTIDNEGRRDEACIGDLIALEAAAAGLDGIVVWGLVRDTAELVAIGLPVYCTGRCPAGPKGVRTSAVSSEANARLGAVLVSAADVIFADDDGVIVVDGANVRAVLDAAADIARRERAQADLVRKGMSLRQQFRFPEYLARRVEKTDYTFREHLASLGAVVEV